MPVVQRCSRVMVREVDRFCPIEVLKMLTDTHPVPVRPTLKDVERRFWNRPFSELKDTCQECKENLNEAQMNSVEFAIQMNCQVLITVQAGAILRTRVKLKIFIRSTTVSRFNC